MPDRRLEFLLVAEYKNELAQHLLPCHIDLQGKFRNKFEMESFLRFKIDGEFERIINIKENRLNDDVCAFLRHAQRSLGSESEQNPRGPFRKSLMHYAAMGDGTELIGYLLRNGAAVDDRDQNKRTPLSHAAESGALNTVKILLKNGAEVNSLDDCYTSPLTWLIYAGQGNNLKPTKDLLISKGARTKGAKRGWILNKINML